MLLYSSSQMYCYPAEMFICNVFIEHCLFNRNVCPPYKLRISPRGTGRSGVGRSRCAHHVSRLIFLVSDDRKCTLIPVSEDEERGVLAPVCQLANFVFVTAIRTSSNNQDNHISMHLSM